MDQLPPGNNKASTLSNGRIMSAAEIGLRLKLRQDLRFYAEKCLVIKDKVGTIRPFVFNRAQNYIDSKLEEQKKRTGCVRAIILKGRQQGVSTYTGGRIYHRVTNSLGKRAFILTHEASATDNLFRMVEFFHNNCPSLVRPTTGIANAKELSFPELDGAGYKVGTAGSKGVGRSSTIHLFHGSEVAFWPNADAHVSGVMQAVPLGPDTEIILESTANGIGNFFHQAWQRAEKEEGDFIPIFVPWFWQDEYIRDVPPDFKATPEEEELQDIYDLTPSQIMWRRSKVAESSEIIFKQEYPNNPQEAFIATDQDSFIRAESVMRARKFTTEGIGPLIIGVDPSRMGKDRFAIARRKGRKVYNIEAKLNIDNVAGANWVKQVVDSEHPDRVFIDVGGVGGGVFDILKSWGNPYSALIVPINFGGAPQEPVQLLPSGQKRPGPKNRRSEMWQRSKAWLEDPAGVDIPDDDALMSDACGPGYSYDANQRLVLESKEHMAHRGFRSPDLWDSVVLTFAEPVGRSRKPYIIPRFLDGILGKDGLGWMD